VAAVRATPKAGLQAPGALWPHLPHHGQADQADLGHFRLFGGHGAALS
jgi:hypothetical protein